MSTQSSQTPSGSRTNDLPSYQTLLAELNALLQSIEHDAVGIDDISAKLALAYERLELLKSRLTSAEARVEEIINARAKVGGMDSAPPGALRADTD